MGVWLKRLASVGPATFRWVRGWRWQFQLLAAVFWCLTLPLLIHVWYITFGGNFHTVVPGAVYRCGQPSGDELRRICSVYHIRTVINLRGDNTEQWYYDEHDAGRAMGVRVVDAGLWATQPPPVEPFRILVETLADAPGPVLVHCNSGGDRSGLASALAVLLRSDGTLDQARRQLSLYYGHSPFGQAACHERLLDRYEEWLAKNNWTHSPGRLRTWAFNVYVPDECWP
ncbi:MAG TPA: tyrosine-protein phosphatase [Gemmataceae bacterium]|nr:tyrosine-protein phosphatase [Gemmataceae bacterium]